MLKKKPIKMETMETVSVLRLWRDKIPNVCTFYIHLGYPQQTVVLWRYSYLRTYQVYIKNVVFSFNANHDLIKCFFLKIMKCIESGDIILSQSHKKGLNVFWNFLKSILEHLYLPRMPNKQSPLYTRAKKSKSLIP